VTRLIASDVDGTLLPTPDTPLSDAFFEDIRRLRRKGVLFCAASGRSYATLRRVFEPVVSEMVFLPENGAAAYQNDRPLYHIPMPRAVCRELTEDICARPDCEVRVSGPEHCYLLPKGPAIVQRVRRTMPNLMRIVERFDEIPEEITKISAFCPDGTAEPAKALLPKWQERLDAAVTCAQWIDFTAAGKGVGLRRLCEHFGIDLKDTVAFGDNFNDVSMLEIAGTAYIMESACEELRERFQNHCGSVQAVIRAMADPLGQ